MASRGRACAADKIKPDAKAALIVTDVQNCFVDGGTLPVKGGADIVPIINKLAPAFAEHRHHPGLAHAGPCLVRQSAHPGKKPFETTQLSYGTQVLWPDHCIQGTEDAAVRKDLKLPKAELIIRKGYHKHIDSYSAFRRPTARPRPGSPATSRSAASTPCS